MPTVTAYRNGLSLGMGGRNNNPAKRDRITGWSPGAVRRHTRWLYGVNAPALDGDGYAFTLTMRDCPESAEAFHAARRAWIMRVQRMGAIRVHWVVEWQRRGVPHLHCAVYFPTDHGFRPEEVIGRVLVHWLKVADEWNPGHRSQDGSVIDGPLGWLQYLSKHAARGFKHYQRMGKPEGWASTGRLWGYTGEWPVDEPMRFEMPVEAFWRYRRLVRGWRIADARASGNPARIRAARRMLAANERKLSSVRGVSDWIPEELAVEFVDLLIREGYPITEKSTPPPPADS